MEIMTEDIIRYVMSLSIEQRMEFLFRLEEKFCFECGRNQPKAGGLYSQRCQCWNDE